MALSHAEGPLVVTEGVFTLENHTLSFAADGTITDVYPAVTVTITFPADGSVKTVYGDPMNKTVITSFPSGTIVEALS